MGRGNWRRPEFAAERVAGARSGRKPTRACGEALLSVVGSEKDSRWHSSRLWNEYSESYRTRGSRPQEPSGLRGTRLPDSSQDLLALAFSHGRISDSLAVAQVPGQFRAEQPQSSRDGGSPGNRHQP